MDANEMAIFITNWMGKRGLVTTSEQAMNVKELCFDVQKAAAIEIFKVLDNSSEVIHSSEGWTERRITEIQYQELKKKFLGVE